jgi:uncharacterized membrane protein YbhN (UPF0104 family)
MVLLPIVFMVGAIPIAPAGLGTTQATAVALFATYASGTAEEARASVLAYSLAFQVASTPFLIVIGLVCLRLTTREVTRGATNVAQNDARDPGQ